ncbi:MAG: hypothetical protein PGN20_15695 [Agrobacterium cavarae]
MRLFSPTGCAGIPGPIARIAPITFVCADTLKQGVRELLAAIPCYLDGWASRDWEGAMMTNLAKAGMRRSIVFDRRIVLSENRVRFSG